MKVNKIFESFAKSKLGQNLYKHCVGEKADNFLNNTLPTVETIFSTACYCYATAKRKEIPKDQRDLLQWQNVLSGLAGVTLGTVANRWISKQTDKIVKDIDPKVLDPKALRKVSTGLRIITPIIATGVIMRFLLPTITAGVSGKIMDKQREKRGQILDKQV